METPNRLLAQGSTEYLVVLSTVLIISLLSISLLGYFPGISKDTASASSKTYWQGAARPFRVVEVSQTNETTLSFILENAEADAVRLMGVGIGGVAALFAEGDNPMSDTGAINFGAGEKKLVKVDISSTECMKGNLKNVVLSFTYETEFGTPKVETSDKQLVMQCNYDNAGTAVAGSTSVLAIVTDQLPIASEGDSAYDVTFVASGGVPPYRWGVQGITPQMILALQAQGGQYSYDPSGSIHITGSLHALVGSYPLTINVTDAVNSTASKQMVFTVQPAANGSMNGSSSGTAYEGELYSFGITFPQATGPIICSITAGSLPAGFAQVDTGGNATCAYGGTAPRGTADQYQISLSIVDSSDPPKNGYWEYSLDLQPVRPLQIIADNSTVLYVGQPSGLLFIAQGGIQPKSWTVIGLPPGIAFVDTGNLGTQALYGGVPSAAGTYEVNITATDAESTVATKSLNLTVSAQ